MSITVLLKSHWKSIAVFALVVGGLTSITLWKVTQSWIEIVYGLSSLIGLFFMAGKLLTTGPNIKRAFNSLLLWTGIFLFLSPVVLKMFFGNL